MNLIVRIYFFKDEKAKKEEKKEEVKVRDARNDYLSLALLSFVCCLVLFV